MFSEPGREAGPPLLVWVITSHPRECLTVSSKVPAGAQGHEQNTFPREARRGPMAQLCQRRPSTVSSAGSQPRWEQDCEPAFVTEDFVLRGQLQEPSLQHVIPRAPGPGGVGTGPRRSFTCSAC